MEGSGGGKGGDIGSTHFRLSNKSLLQWHIPTWKKLWFVNVVDLISQTQSVIRVKSEKAAAPERIFTLLGPLLVWSQSDDFPAVGGALVADVTTCGIKYSYVNEKQYNLIHEKWVDKQQHIQMKNEFSPILLLVVWMISVSSAVCCLSFWRYLSAKYLKTKGRTSGLCVSKV